MFAYGQTGSGKTFTITGGAESYNDRGLIPRSLSMIFNEAQRVNTEKILRMHENFTYIVEFRYATVDLYLVFGNLQQSRV